MVEDLVDQTNNGFSTSTMLSQADVFPAAGSHGASEQC